jgi:hypothetical protein
MPGRAAHLIEYAGETGVGLQHLAILVGRQAYAQIWPRIISWLKAPRQAQETHHAPYQAGAKTRGREA